MSSIVPHQACQPNHRERESLLLFLSQIDAGLLKQGSRHEVSGEVSAFTPFQPGFPVDR